MGVVIHILDRRTVRLDVAGTVQEIGTLRHFAKVTELDEHRTAELEKASQLPSPAAVVVAFQEHWPIASRSKVPVAVHLVLGWDEGRTSVTDLSWDYLPVLGYAVWDSARDLFVLYEPSDEMLYPIDLKRAVALGLLSDGVLVRHGQPTIAACYTVRPFIRDFVEADCVLTDGRRDRLIVRIDDNTPPEPSWLIGRTPGEVRHYVPGVLIDHHLRAPASRKPQ